MAVMASLCENQQLLPPDRALWAQVLWIRFGGLWMRGGGPSGTLLRRPAVTLLWNDVTARTWRRRGGHYWSFSNYSSPNKYWRKTPMARATSQLVSRTTFTGTAARSRCERSPLWGYLAPNSRAGPSSGALLAAQIAPALRATGG